MATYEIDEFMCAQNRLCMAVAPSLFHLDDEGIVVTSKDSVEGAEDLELLKAAAAACPALAVKIGS